MAARFQGHCARRPCGRTPIGAGTAQLRPPPDRSFAPLSAGSRGSALAPARLTCEIAQRRLDRPRLRRRPASAPSARLPARSRHAARESRADGNQRARRAARARTARAAPPRAVPIRLDNRTLTYGDVSAVRRRGGARSARLPPGRQAVSVFATRRRSCASLERLCAEAAGAGTDRRPPARRGAKVESRASPDRRGGAGRVGGDRSLQPADRPRASKSAASDIHIDCASEGASVRFRICGVLEPIMTLPASASQSGPQPLQDHGEGRHLGALPAAGRRRSASTSTVAPIDIRAVDAADRRRRENRDARHRQPERRCRRSISLGLRRRTPSTRLRKSLTRPDGLVLVTGPTGSGKTTALYAALGHLRTGQTNIVSVEDPVERTVTRRDADSGQRQGGQHVPGSCGRSCARIPNVIMVGRDPRRRGRADRRTGGLHRPSVLSLAAHDRRRQRDDAPAEPRPRAVQDRREPDGGPGAAAGALACASTAGACIPTVEARRLGRACTTCSRFPASAGPGCEHLQADRLLPARAPIAELLTPSDELRATPSPAAPRLARNSRGDARRGHADHAAAGAGARGRGHDFDRRESIACSPPTRTTPQRDLAAAACSSPTTSRSRACWSSCCSRRNSCEVLEASTGRRGASKSRNGSAPDLLLIDLNMPEMDGYQAIAQVAPRADAGDDADRRC